VLTLARAHLSPVFGSAVISADAVEVRRWSRPVERYAFRDVAALGLRETEKGQLFVGSKLGAFLSNQTRQIPAWERKPMIGFPVWDAVLPLEAAMPPQELLASDP
jgi:hypothetical protein